MFENIRKAAGWAEKDFRAALCDEENFKVFNNSNNGGRSSAFIFHTKNEKLVIKTVTQVEKYLLLDILHAYHDRVTKHPESKIVRILGLYKVRYNKHSFIVMENIITNKTKALVFDLKGSLDNRFVENSTIFNSKVLKDQNFIDMKKSIKVGLIQRKELISGITEDIIFLRTQNIIDYSLLSAFYSDKTESDNRYFIEGTLESYSIGIIDFLQQYTLSKKLELLYKKLKGKKNLSVCPPNKYSLRLIQFLNKIIIS